MYYFDDHGPASNNSILAIFQRDVDKCSMTFRDIIEMLMDTLLIDDDDESGLLQSSTTFKLP